MGLGISTSRSTQQVSNQDQSQATAAGGDNSANAAHGGSVIEGAQIGAGSSRSNINVTTNSTTVDPGSYAFASDVVRNLSGLGAKFADANASIATTAQQTVSKLAQGTPLGVDWKTKLVPIALIAAPLLLVAMFLFRRRKA